MTEPLVIDVRGLTKTFGGKRVVDGVSLQVPRGAIYGFLGPNGSGKTTTIRMVCGLLRADEGSGACLGFDVRNQSAEIKARVGYMTQKFSLYEDLSIRENLDTIARLYCLKDRTERVARAIDDLGLSARAQQLAGTLSGGWKQRLALAACMIHDPQLLLLDEPTAGVDPAARREFWDQIRRFSAAGVTTLVSTHYMDEAVQCDSIAFIAYGKKLVDSPTKELPRQTGLFARRISGGDLENMTVQLRAQPSVSLVARFGDVLHVCGPDEAALDASARAIGAKHGAEVSIIPVGLEESFIHFMSRAKDHVR